MNKATQEFVVKILTAMGSLFTLIYQSPELIRWDFVANGLLVPVFLPAQTIGLVGLCILTVVPIVGLFWEQFTPPKDSVVIYIFGSCFLLLGGGDVAIYFVQSDLIGAMIATVALIAAILSLTGLRLIRLRLVRALTVQKSGLAMMT